jgi:hypothetical protein
VGLWGGNRDFVEVELVVAVVTVGSVRFLLDMLLDMCLSTYYCCARMVFWPGIEPIVIVRVQ